MERPFENLGSRIREARVACGQSQKSLAQELGVSVQSVSQWETGRSQPTADNLLKISSFLEVTNDWLKSGEGHRERFHLRKTEGRDEIIARFAPLMPISSKFSLDFDTPNFPERISDNTIISRYSGVGRLFSWELEADAREPEFRKGDILIFDTGLVPRAGDMILTRSATFGRVKSVEMLDNGSFLARFRTWVKWSNQADNEAVEATAYISSDTMAVLVEHRRFRAK